MRRLLHTAQIGFAPLIEGSRNADEYCVGVFKPFEIRGGYEMTADDELLNLVLRDMLDIRAAGIKHAHFVRIGIETCDFVPRFSEAQRQRPSDVSAADDRHFKLRAFETLSFSFDGHGSRPTPSLLTRSRLRSANSHSGGSPLPAAGSGRQIFKLVRQRHVNIAVSS